MEGGSLMLNTAAAPQEEPVPSFTQGSLEDFVELDDSDLPF